MNDQELSRRRTKLLSAVLVPLLFPLVFVGACGSDNNTPTTTPVTQQQEIVDTAIAAGSFTTLVAALQAADLVTTLKGPGPFTVFVPTDAAFAKLPAGTVDNLLKPENKAMLQAVLTCHVVAGKVPAADVVKLTSAKTMQGQDVTITVQGQT